MRKLAGKCIVWLPYLDSSKTRSEGRRIPKRIALTLPQLQEIVEAAEKLGLNPKPDADVRFPRCWWQKSGAVIVDKSNTKEKILQDLAKKIIEIRNRPSAKC